MQHTIESLRRGGFKVRVHHGFTKDLESCSKNIQEAADRYTRIEITEAGTGRTVEGSAYCSKKDHWNRKLGNRIALSRALTNLNKVEANETMDYLYNPAVTLLSFVPYPENSSEYSHNDIYRFNN